MSNITLVMIGFLTPLADSGISYAYGFVFAGCNILGALLVWFFLYESRMLSLENVDLMYGQPDLTAWSSSKWTPPGYITRKDRDESQFRQMSVSGHADVSKQTSDSEEPMTSSQKEHV